MLLFIEELIWISSEFLVILLWCTLTWYFLLICVARLCRHWEQCGMQLSDQCFKVKSVCTSCSVRQGGVKRYIACSCFKLHCYVAFTCRQKNCNYDF